MSWDKDHGHIRMDAGYKPSSESRIHSNVYEELQSDIGNTTTPSLVDVHVSPQGRSNAVPTPEANDDIGVHKITWRRVVVGLCFIVLAVAFILTTTFLLLDRNKGPLLSNMTDTSATTGVPTTSAAYTTTMISETAVCKPRDYTGFNLCSSKIVHPVEVHTLSIYRAYDDVTAEVKVLINIKPGCSAPKAVKLMLTSYLSVNWTIQTPPGLVISEIVLASAKTPGSSASLVSGCTTCPHMLVFPGRVWYGYGRTVDESRWKVLQRFILDHFGYLSSFIGAHNPAKIHLNVGLCN